MSKQWTVNGRNKTTEVTNFCMVGPADEPPVAYVADSTNAHLFAAALELYGALAAMAEWAGGTDAARLPAPWPEMVRNARGVLAKARGEV